MQPFKHILAATDLSEPSQKAVRLATQLARNFKASLTVVHVFEYPRALYSPAALYAGDLVEPVLEEVEATMAQTLRSISRDIPQASAKIRQGVPYEQILAAAKESGADLIVMGTRGRTGIAHVMLGSVAEKVVRLSRVPVLTVRQPQGGTSHLSAPARAWRAVRHRASRNSDRWKLRRRAKAPDSGVRSPRCTCLRGRPLQTFGLPRPAQQMWRATRRWRVGSAALVAECALPSFGPPARGPMRRHRRWPGRAANPPCTCAHEACCTTLGPSRAAARERARRLTERAQRSIPLPPAWPGFERAHRARGLGLHLVSS